MSKSLITHSLQRSSHIDRVLSTHAVAGVPGGHQVQVKSWHEAAMLYNSLLDKGLIIRVRA